MILRTTPYRLETDTYKNLVDKANEDWHPFDLEYLMSCHEYTVLEPSKKLKLIDLFGGVRDD